MLVLWFPNNAFDIHSMLLFDSFGPFEKNAGEFVEMKRFESSTGRLFCVRQRVCMFVILQSFAKSLDLPQYVDRHHITPDFKMILT